MIRTEFPLVAGKLKGENRGHGRNPYGLHRRRKQEFASAAWSLVAAGVNAWRAQNPAPYVVRFDVALWNLWDSDNLQAALKGYRDGTASSLGLGDSPRDPILWVYDQHMDRSRPGYLVLEVWTAAEWRELEEELRRLQGDA